MTTELMRGKRTRGARDAGREKLLEAARAHFRSRTRHEVSRQDIARLAGVTPALMSYYFDSNAELVLASTRPIIADAISNLSAVLKAPAPLEVRLGGVVGLFIDFARVNGPLLDIFVEAAVEYEDLDAQALLRSCLDELGLFFSEAVQAGLLAGDSNPRFLLLAIWGMCRLVAESPPLPFPVFGLEPADAERRRAESELVLNLVLHGAGTR